MRSIAIALVLGGAALLMDVRASQAEITYPWCAQYGEQSGARNCGFSTYQQCSAAISGNGGYCEQNPLYRPGAEPAPARLRSRR
jgi:Protein of unknown function (DUF3551)